MLTALTPISCSIVKNRDLNSNSLAALLLALASAWMCLILVSCSKQPEAPKTEDAITPTSANKEQAQLPAMSTPASIPTQATITSEEVDVYAAAFGIDTRTAKALLSEEMMFWKKINAAIKSSDASELSRLVMPHVDKLKHAITTLGKYHPDPNGKLPKWWDEINSREGVEGLSIRMNKPGYLGIDQVYFIDQRATYGSISNAARTQPELLNEIIVNRVNDLPSPLDAIIYQGIIDGLADNVSSQRADSSGPDEDQPGSDAVRHMATGTNPIYRLIAVEQAKRLNTVDRLDLYESFIEEKDPQIKQRAIEGLAQTRSDDNIKILRRFERKALQQGDNENANLANQAIKRLETNSP